MLAQRPFRIEAPDHGVSPDEQPGRPDVYQRLDKIFVELADLRSLVGRISERDVEAEQRRNMKALWEGVDSIRSAIDHTRTEISSLHSKGIKGERINRATDELETVVLDTESATETILAAAEVIDNATDLLLRGRLDETEQEIVADVHAQAIRIFEACNFQDISGQRIRKVVSLLQFVEGCIGNMVEIWKKIDGFDPLELAAAEEESVTIEQALLNGPALATDEGVVSQDDIDSLFG